MNAKRIIAPDMRRALKLVREQLGDDAVILQNKTIAEGVELIATTEKIGALMAQFETNKSLQQSAAEELQPAIQPQPSTHKRIRGSVRNLGKLERFIKPLEKKSAHVDDSALDKAKAKDFASELSNAAKVLAQPEPPVQSTPESVLTQVTQTAAERYALKQLPPQAPVRTKTQGEGKTKHVEHSDPKDEAIGVQKVDARQPTDSGYNVAIDTLRDEVALLRALLMSQSSQQQWSYYRYAEPLRAHLLQRMVHLGFEPNLAKQWVMALAVDPEQGLRCAWRNLLEFVVKQIPVTGPGVFANAQALALIGPTGAGKTATICKIASAYVLETGLKDLAVISTDAFRMGATDELSRLCQILDIPLHVVDDHQDLERLLSGYSGRRKVLIDTAGLVSTDPDWALQCEILLNASQNVRHYLVLATTHQLPVHLKAIHDYAQLPIEGCVLTKLDECERLAETLSAVVDSGFSVAYVTTGMRLSEDLHIADQLSLVKKAFDSKLTSGLDPVMMTQCFENLAVSPTAMEKKHFGGSTREVI